MNYFKCYLFVLIVIFMPDLLAHSRNCPSENVPELERFDDLDKIVENLSRNSSLREEIISAFKESQSNTALLSSGVTCTVSSYEGGTGGNLYYHIECIDVDENTFFTEYNDECLIFSPPGKALFYCAI